MWLRGNGYERNSALKAGSASDIIKDRSMRTAVRSQFMICSRGMKLLIEKGRKYGFWDFIRIPFQICPAYAGIKMLNQAAASVLPAVQVLVTAAFIDTALDIFAGNAQRSAVLTPLAGLMLIVAYNNLNWQLMSYINLKLEMRLTCVYRTEIAQKRAKLEYRHIEDNDAWELISRVCDDPVGKVTGGFQSIMGAANIVLRVGSLLVILMAQVWWAGLAIVGMSAPLFYLAIKSGQQIYEENKEAQKLKRRAEYLRSVLQGRESAEERALFGYTDQVNRKWFEKYEAARRIRVRVEGKYFVRMKGSSLITVVLSLLIISVLLFPLKSGAISAGMFMGLVTSTLNLIQMMSWELSNTMNEIAKNAEYLKDLTAFAALSEAEGALEPPVDKKGMTLESLKFCHVSFRYPGTDAYILKDFDLCLEGGRHYAFVGVNGAGKTTVAKLLTGLYDDYEGEILVNGRELRRYAAAQRKALFSVVYQDFAKYQISMEDNIALGNVTERDETKIRAAAELIGLSDVIKGLPRGMQTPLGKVHENGVDLSGGQWQRLAIARAIYNPAAVQILDEPTAALDPVAESNIYEMFGRVSVGKSTIFITHRLGAARLADEIIVIDGGRAAERGSHEALLSKGGIYASMFEAQRSWYQ